MLALSRTRTSGIVAAFSPALAKAAVAAKRAAAWPVRAIQARRQLAQLSELSDHELKDFGLYRSDISAAHSVGVNEDPTVFLARTVNDRARARRQQAAELVQWAKRRG